MGAIAVFLCAVVLLVVPSAEARSLDGAAVPHKPWQNGVTVTAWWHDHYGKPAAADALAAVAGTGATHVALIATWYMDSGTSSTIAPRAEKTPSDASLLAAMQTARELGLRVVLKPHVDVVDGTFRGAIRPLDVERWFGDYRAMTAHYANLARLGGASLLVVGTELTSMSRYEAAFRRVIAVARAGFPGRLTFAANMVDGARRVAFWDALDYIGVDAYMPLSSAEHPTVPELTRAWSSRGYMRQLRRLHLRYRKQVLFTEIGYESRVGTAAQPWGGVPGAPDAESQRRAYEAAYAAWWRVPWFAGLYWWEWRAWRDSGEASFSPAGRPAEQTVRAWSLRQR